ncbi:translation initiation factor eIF3 subunit [Eremomyces bilateralis CBS 781.70]|uniref:Eukaryotic translation initiation factor 3 subunit J n=1 Tax=Eremomyces bilateralis CBS 781.70 TaxID=1392243 RepID=A0A6G1GC72_9PEZI|nr:translation initiation factor eIF3 subunit [Eremomyces bilateralis CBS 781.70]KAF1815695.1 translation initiation factor eIF3 subunit [Eremomyces bilateralis CBS 781.70]
MPPSKWDDEDEESTPPTSPPPIARRSKFDDEEEDSDVLESWSAAEDSEVEREKEKKAAELKAKADAEAKAKHKSKTQRIEERQREKQRQRELEEETSDSDEDELDRRARLKQAQIDADLRNAQDLFADVAVSSNRGGKHITVPDASNPTNSIDLSSMPLFNPHTKDQFAKMREALVPLVSANSKKPQYPLFMPEFVKGICKDMSSDQIKKAASALSTLSNEKLKQEKAADKGGKKTKVKAKATLSAGRDISTRADTTLYDDDGLDDGDFM